MRLDRVACLLVAVLAARSARAREDDLSLASAVDLEGTRSLSAVLRAGAQATEEEATLFERRLAADPKDLEARLLLIGRGAGAGSSDAHVDRVLGLIEHHAAAPVADAVATALESAGGDEPAWERARAAWAKRVEASPEDPRVLGNAGVFLTASGRPAEQQERGLSMLLAAHAKEPKEPRWLLRLTERRSALPVAERFRVLRALHDALPPDVRRSHYLRPEGALLATEVALAAWDAGERDAAGAQAEDVLSWATPAGLRWDYGNVLHDMNLLLGRVALARGDEAAAVAALLRAGSTPGSPQLASFGPQDLSLARDLLAKGRRDEVLRFLDLAQAWWHEGEKRIAEWRRAVKEGRTPDLPVRRAPEPPRLPGTKKVAPRPPAEGPDRPLAGLWESEGRSRGGIGGALELLPDGRFRTGAVVLVEGRYEVKGEQVLLRFADSPEPTAMPLGTVDGDTWTVASPGEALVKTRLPGGPSGPPSFVGTWSYEHYTKTRAFERWDADGTMALRIPMPGVREGRYEVVGGTVRWTHDDGGKDEDLFRVEGDRLSLTDSGGKTRSYRWAGEKAWYAWPALPPVPPR